MKACYLASDNYLHGTEIYQFFPGFSFSEVCFDNKQQLRMQVCFLATYLENEWLINKKNQQKWSINFPINEKIKNQDKETGLDKQHFKIPHSRSIDFVERNNDKQNTTYFQVILSHLDIGMVFLF